MNTFDCSFSFRILNKSNQEITSSWKFDITQDNFKLSKFLKTKYFKYFIKLIFKNR